MIGHNKILTNPHEHNAQCLLGIDDDWTYTDIKYHLEWLIRNPNEIADGYMKKYITNENKSLILGWVLYYKNKANKIL
jgi:hypothetical protein